MDARPAPYDHPMNAALNDKIGRPPIAPAERGFYPSGVAGAAVGPRHEPTPDLARYEALGRKDQSPGVRNGVPLSQTLALAEQVISALADQVQRLEEAAVAMHGFELAPDGPATAFPAMATGDTLYWLLETRMAGLLIRLQRVAAFTDTMR